MSQAKPPKIEKKRTVAVSNVSAEMTEKELSDYFSYCGVVEVINFIPDPQNPGNQKAVVMFTEEEGAELAQLLSGSILAEQEIHVDAVKVDASPITITEVSEAFRSFVGRKSRTSSLSPPVTPRTEDTGSKRPRRRRKSGTEQRLEEKVKKYKSYFDRMSKDQKVASAGALCLAAAGAIFIGKQVAENRRKERERETRCLIAAYDHLFKEGPRGN
eukprot:TRINITY_DN23577_c0_g1_i1.p1 TRINITY_DN23577_c0_g1~~TRINITY_DN23577_c0_g1_i1.p1  ORF type:complete len:215 (+),score=54.14 TRINITY_DN23577_c0_g1_i1:138-782(+)